MSVLKYKNSKGAWVEADFLATGEFKFATVEPLGRETKKIGYDLSPWVDKNENFLLLFTTDLNSTVIGDAYHHVVYRFDGEFSGLKHIYESNTNTDLSMDNDSMFAACTHFNVNFNQETSTLLLTSNKPVGEDIANGRKAYNAILFYCG